MSIKTRMAERLNSIFSPAALEVLDESDRHKGHGGWREGGETHFRIRIVADAFSGMSRVARHRAINEAAAEFFAEGLHALAIEARTPDEPDPRARQPSQPAG